MSMKGRSKLASKLQSRMSNVSEFNKTVNLELGTIGAGYSLELDSLPGVKLKKNEYYVCQSVKKLAKDVEYISNHLSKLSVSCTEGTATLSPSSFTRKVETNILKTGDRVLVAWTFDGEVVVIDKIISANSL